jgi:hypothetical protein
MLSEAQKIAYDRYGFLVLDGVLGESILEPLRSEYAALLDALYRKWHGEGCVPVPPDGLGFEERLRIAYAAGCDWFQPMDISLPGGTIDADCPMHFGPAVLAMATAPALLDVVESLIGPEITSNPIQHVRIKPPAVDLRDNEVRTHLMATGWHQDRGVNLPEADETEMVTVWVAVTDATVESGCLQVIPGSHTEPLKTHCPNAGGPGPNIPEALLGSVPPTPLPVRAGGLVVFHPKLAHASLHNTSERIRWSFDLRYSRAGQPTGRAHFPSFVARSRAAPESELRDAGEWRRRWEAARAMLSQRPHIPIHRWVGAEPACA